MDLSSFLAQVDLHSYWAQLVLGAVGVVFILIIFGVPIALVVLNFVIVYLATKNNKTISKDEERSRLLTIMPCPKCKLDMEMGRTKHPDGMLLFEDFNKPPARYRLWKVLPCTVSNRWYRGNRAWRCPQCQIVVVEYGYMVED